MEKINYHLGGSFDDWRAMLPADFEIKHKLTQLIDIDYSNKTGPYESDEIIPFILVGNRTWDLSTEEYEELGYDGFAKKYPYGKPLEVPTKNGSEFREILQWGSLPGIEHEVVQHPHNGGGGRLPLT